MAYEDTADGHDAVVFLNSLGMDKSFWRKGVIPRLDPGLRTVSLNYRDPTAGRPELCTVEMLVSDVCELIEHLSIRRSILVGYSLGALVAQECTLRLGPGVEGLGLVATFGRTTAFQRALMNAEAAIYRGTSGTNLNVMVLIDMMQVCSFVDLHNDALFQKILEKMARGTDYQDKVRQAHFFAGANYANRLPMLTAISCPTVVVAFGEDAFAPPFLAWEVARAIGDTAKYFEIPKAAHLGMFTHRHQVLEALHSILPGA